MPVDRGTRSLVERLLPRVLTGVEAELTAALSPHGGAALSLVPRALLLQRIGTDLTYECASEDRIAEPDALLPFERFARTAADRELSPAVLRLGIGVAYTASIQVALAEVSAAERPVLMPLVAWAAQLGPMIEQAEVRALLTRQRDRIGVQWHRRQLARGLLTGQPLTSTPAPAYLLALVSPTRGTTLPEIEQTMAEANVLMVSRPRFVVVLHPLPAPAKDMVTTVAHHPPIPAVDALGATVRVVLAHGRTEHLPAAYREAVTAWHIVHSRGYPAGHYDLLSVLTDGLVARDTDIATRLRALLAPLTRSPVLVDTLRHWLLGDTDRRTVAARLHVHPNTLDRRLRQIEELTGLSVTRHSGLHLLHLALAALSAPGAHQPPQ